MQSTPDDPPLARVVFPETQLACLDMGPGDQMPGNPLFFRHFLRKKNFGRYLATAVVPNLNAPLPGERAEMP